MTLSQCPSEERLARYVAGDCEPQQTADIDRHVEGCNRCRRRVDAERLGDAFVDDVRGRGDAKQTGYAAALRLAAIAARRAPSPGTSIPDLIAQGLLEESPDDEYPARLGPYRIIEYVGRGGMGIVLKAHDQNLDREVAVKILRPELTDDEIALARFTREAKSAAALRSPNVVRVYSVGTEGSIHYLVMEYIEGPTLAQVIRQGCPIPSGVGEGASPLPTDLIREIFRQLLSGLSAAHQAGLIHRDVKPSNILLDYRLQKSECGSAEVDSAGCPIPSGVGEGQDFAFRIPNSAFVKLADFGLARMMTAQTRLTVGHATPGTPEYMSPEQVRSQDDLDHHTDLYSAGVVLYEMLTGHTPFKANTPAAVIHRILNEHPRDPRTLNPQADRTLAALALRLTAKAPADRMQSAAETLAALDEPHPVPLPQRRRRFTQYIGGALALLTLVVGGLWLLQIVGGRMHAPTPLGEGQRHIQNVEVKRNPRGSKTRTVLADWGDGYQPFWSCPPAASPVHDAAVVEIDGRDDTYVAVGLAHPVNNANLLLLDKQGDQIWPVLLSRRREWPDAKPPSAFACRAVWAGNFDGQPGDELIVAANDIYDYPTVIAFIDVLSGDIRVKLWHFGHIDGLMTIPNYFGRNHPAILALGTNNKLDGFFDPSRNDFRVRAEYDYVPVVMLFDPRRILSLASASQSEFFLRVPDTNAVDLPSVIPHGYAFFDLPTGMSAKNTAAGQANGVLPDSFDIAAFSDSRFGPCPSGSRCHGTDECIMLAIKPPETVLRPWIHIYLDMDLELCTAFHAPPHWLDRWHVIVRDGKYVDD